MSLSVIVNSASQHGPPELNRIDYLDGWRGMAILLVLISHFLNIKFLDFGRMGVDVFFVLSGMLMSNILFVKKVDLLTFYKRRISRILPVFVIFLSIISFSSWIFSLSEEHLNYLYNLFFIRAYWPVEPDLWSTGLPIGHLWSLNVEEHSYIVLSLITVIPAFRNKPYIPILSFGLFAIILQYIYVKYPSISSVNYHLRTEIAASFLLLSAGYFLIKQRLEKYVPSWLPLVTLTLSFLCYSNMSPHWTTKWTIAPFLLAFSVNHLDLTPKFFKKMLCFKPLRILGIWSFSIYLWQQPLYFYGNNGGDPLNFVGVILMLAAITIGAFSFYWIENPIRTYLNEKW